MSAPRVNAAAHGTRSMYVDGCRCQPCTDASTRYMAGWRDRRRAAGTHRLLHGRWVKK